MILKAFKNQSSAVNAYRGAFWFLVLDKMPQFTYASRLLEDDEKMSYERHKPQRLYYSTRSPFVSTYVHDPGSKGAFGGGEVKLKMNDGSTQTFKGDLWSSGQGLVDKDVFSVGINTRSKLKGCYVYMASYIDLDYFGEWLDNNPNKIFEYERGAL